MSEEPFDYEALNRALESLGHLRVRSQNVQVSGPEVIAGGYGDVQRGWLALADGPGGSWQRKDVALKTIRPVGTNDDRARVAFRVARELNVWANLRHPNVLPLLGFFLSDDMTVAQLISPFEPHGHIEEYLKKAQPSQAKRLHLAMDTTLGLAYLHGCDPSICHGDLKARNVLVNGDIRAVLCDFGLAKAMESGPTGLTTSVTFRGSMRYLSPELTEEQPRRTLRSDIWAYACLLLEIFLDLKPYKDVQSDSGVIRKLIEGSPPASLETLQVDSDTRGLLTACFQFEPEARPNILECFRVLDGVSLRSGSKYSALSVTAKLGPACLLCRRYPQMHASAFCSVHCSTTATESAPMLLFVPCDDPSFVSVAEQFEADWKDTRVAPAVRYVYRVVMSEALDATFHRKRAEIEQLHSFEAKGLSKANERLRWYGTWRGCRVGDPGLRALTMCSSWSCSVCVIMKNSFDVAESKSRLFGAGIYTSGTSSRSYEYARQATSTPSDYRAMLLNRVLEGKAKTLTHANRSLRRPPAGYDSVRGVLGGGVASGYDELIVHSNDLIRPLYLVLCDNE